MLHYDVKAICVEGMEMKRTENVIETRSLGEQVYQYLCSQIINGNIRYGETLNIKAIAKELNISPMPIREAIKRLENEGLVLIKPRSMCMLREPTRDSILNAISMRELLEIYCVETVYRTVAPEGLDTLKEITKRMAVIVAQKEKGNDADISSYIKNDGQFHMALCHLADNPFIDKSYREISLHLNMNHLYSIGCPPDIIQTHKDHCDLLEALESHSAQAVVIIKKHLKQSRMNVLKGNLFSTMSG